MDFPQEIRYVTREDLQIQADSATGADYLLRFESEADFRGKYDGSSETKTAMRYLLCQKEKAAANRINALSMVVSAGSGHIGGSFSETEILRAIYSFMKHEVSNPDYHERDRLVLSKGHATPGLYAELAMNGFFDNVVFECRGRRLSGFELLDTFRRDDGYLPGHAKTGVAGVDASTGSLGTGLSIASGIALGLRGKRKKPVIFVILGDGELQEGQIWEAAGFAAHYNLGNVIAVADHNGFQNDGPVSKTLGVNPVNEKFKACGWTVLGRDISWEERTANNYRDGHDIVCLRGQIYKAKCGESMDKPVLIIANTDKGRGVSFMSGNPSWHGKAPDKSEYKSAMEELFAELENIRSEYRGLRE